jgi:hypothetical protein
MTSGQGQLTPTDKNQGPERKLSEDNLETCIITEMQQAPQNIVQAKQNEAIMMWPTPAIQPLTEFNLMRLLSVLPQAPPKQLLKEYAD